MSVVMLGGDWTGCVTQPSWPPTNDLNGTKGDCASMQQQQKIIGKNNNNIGIHTQKHQQKQKAKYRRILCVR